MKHILYKAVVTSIFILLSTSNVSAQNHTLTDAEKKALEDSLMRELIRENVPGLEEYGRDVFRDVKYDENGMATIILPVIIKSCGRSVDFYEDDEKIIKGLVDYEYPMTSIEFLYRGKVYYIPVSIKVPIPIEKDPNDNDLYEISISLFNPKVFGYSKKTIPYPFCLIEQITSLY